MAASTRVIFPVLVAISAIGCVNPIEETVRTRAAHDFRCSEDEVKVWNLGGTTYRVKGCGDSAVYDCTQSAGRGGPGTLYLCLPEGERPSSD